MASTDLAHIQRIDDPRERARLAHALIGELQAEAAEASRIRSDAVSELIAQHGATRIQVAELLGVSRERIRQILVEGPPPERALLALDPGPLTICVIAKREAERGGAAIAETTAMARDDLADLASSWDITVSKETVPFSGMIDLNRPNLAVLMGPRSSMLVAQAISADPVVKWQQDKNGEDWFITDTKTGIEYHSDFDRGTDADLPWPRTCYAHIGRIRRPDGQGSWLCLAGEHRPGVAGAAELIRREAAFLWEQAHRSLWSAVVRVKAREDGTPADVSLITPVYVHGKR